MEFLSFIGSLNKLSLLAFLATGGALIYEIYLLRKEKAQKSLPRIPQFPPENQETAQPTQTPVHTATPPSKPTVHETRHAVMRPVVAHKEDVQSTPMPEHIVKEVDESSVRTPGGRPLLLLVSVITFGLLSVVFVSLILRRSSNQPSSQAPSIQTKVVNSSGIRIYSDQWKLIPDSEISKIVPGETINIGIVTIPGSDIDMARIRVNENEWQKENEVTNFNQGYNIFYRQYVVPEGTKELRIEAQLHSSRRGWLGE